MSGGRSHRSTRLLASDQDPDAIPAVSGYVPTPWLAEETPVVGPAAAAGTNSWGRRATSGEFEIVSVLGRGGMGDVMLAQQVHLGREVAIKVLGLDRRLPEHIACLAREGRIAARIDHPNVVPVHDAGDDYFVMRRIRGRTVSDLLVEGRPLRELVEALRRVCDAVSYAHELGVVHRDIKPANIMVGDHGQVLLVDWGLAVEGTRDAAGAVHYLLSLDQLAAGTPSYLAPEVAAADPTRFGPGCDVYLLGATLYHMLTGRPPHRGLDMHEAVAAATANRYQPVVELAPEAPQRLIELQRRAMQSDPADRGTAADLRDGLVVWLRSLEDEREAERLAREADRQLQAVASAASVRERYEAFHRAEDGFVQALALWRDCPAASGGLGSVRSSYALAAVANGDLALASAIAQRAADPALAEQVAGAVIARRQRRQRSVLLRFGVLTCLLLAASLTWASAQWILAASDREMAKRSAEATELLRQARALEAQTAGGHQQRLSLLYRALGLDPATTHARSELAEALLEYADWACTAGSWDLAAQLLEPARSHGADPERLAQVQAQVVAGGSGRAEARRIIVHHRLERLGQLVAELQAGTGEGREAQAAEIAAWDGDEHLPAIRALIAHPEVVVRSLVLSLASYRDDWDLDRELADLARTDPDPRLRQRALAAIAARDRPASAPAVIDILRALPAGLPRHWAASLLEPRLREALVAAAERSGDWQLLRWAGQNERWIDRLVGDADCAPDELEEALLAAWWRCDAARVDAAQRALAARHPDASRLVLIEAEQLREAGDSAAAAGLLAAAAVDHPARLLPLRILLAYELGQAGTLRTLARRLAGTPAGDLGPQLGDAVAALRLAPDGLDSVGDVLHAAWVQDLVEPLQEIDLDLALGRHQLALERALVLHERTGGDARSMALAAVAAERSNRPQLAQRLVQRSLLRDPHAATAHELLARIGLRNGEVDAAAQAATRALKLDSELVDARRTLVLARAGGAEGSIYHILSAHGPVWGDPLLVRYLIERGHGAELLQRLTTIRDPLLADLPLLRRALDQLLLAVPELRRRGWPGMRGSRLAWAVLDEVRVLAEQPRVDPELLTAVLRQARAHGGAVEGFAALDTFFSSLLDGDAAAAITAVDAVADVDGLPSMLRSRLGLWRQHLLDSGPVLPLPRPELDPLQPQATYPARPLVPIRLEAEQAAAFRQWWASTCVLLPPDGEIPLAEIEAWAETCRTEGWGAWFEDIAFGPPAVDQDQ